MMNRLLIITIAFMSAQAFASGGFKNKKPSGISEDQLYSGLVSAQRQPKSGSVASWEAIQRILAQNASFQTMAVALFREGRYTEVAIEAQKHYQALSQATQIKLHYDRSEQFRLDTEMPLYCDYATGTAALDSAVFTQMQSLFDSHMYGQYAAVLSQLRNTRFVLLIAQYNQRVLNNLLRKGEKEFWQEEISRAWLVPLYFYNDIAIVSPEDPNTVVDTARNTYLNFGRDFAAMDDTASRTLLSQLLSTPAYKQLGLRPTNVVAWSEHLEATALDWLQDFFTRKRCSGQFQLN